MWLFVLQGLLTVAQERASDVSDSEESNESSNGDIGADIEKLDHKVDLLAQANALLEEERDGLIVEKACVNILAYLCFSHWHVCVNCYLSFYNCVFAVCFNLYVY